MKKLLFLLCAASLLGLAGCASVDIPSLGGVVSQGADTPVADFHSDEVLSSTGDATLQQSDYYIAKVMTPASDATKNQAQVLFVNDGSKSWVKWTLPSRKAAKADFAVGSLVLYPAGWSGSDQIAAADYRGNVWRLGRVTSVDELFKNVVEIAGSPYAVSNLRAATIKVEE
jgi:hypothetical protein